jgi:hypothetical protein
MLLLVHGFFHLGHVFDPGAILNWSAESVCWIITINVEVSSRLEHIWRLVDVDRTLPLLIPQVQLPGVIEGSSQTCAPQSRMISCRNWASFVARKPHALEFHHALRQRDAGFAFFGSFRSGLGTS